MKRAMTWVLIHAVMAIILLQWVMNDQLWAENIMKFAIWFSLIVYSLTLFSDDLRDKGRKKGRSVHKSIAHWYDAAALILIVGWGSVFYGVLYLISILFEAAIFDAGDENDAD